MLKYSKITMCMASIFFKDRSKLFWTVPNYLSFLTVQRVAVQNHLDLSKICSFELTEGQDIKLFKITQY